LQRKQQGRWASVFLALAHQA